MKGAMGQAHQAPGRAENMAVPPPEAPCQGQLGSRRLRADDAPAARQARAGEPRDAVGRGSGSGRQHGCTPDPTGSRRRAGDARARAQGVAEDSSRITLPAHRSGARWLDPTCAALGATSPRGARRAREALEAVERGDMACVLGRRGRQDSLSPPAVKPSRQSRMFVGPPAALQRAVPARKSASSAVPRWVTRMQSGVVRPRAKRGR